MNTSMVIATSSSALFDLSAEDKIFREQGAAAYAEYQMEHENVPLEKGYAFNLVAKFLRLNELGLGATR
jgi:5'-nucleotidase